MYGGYFNSKEEAEEYKLKHEHYVMVVEYIKCVGKWALVFNLKAVK